MTKSTRSMVVVVTAAITLLTAASGAHAASAVPRFCGPLASSKSLRALSAVVADLASQPASRQAHVTLVGSISSLRRARRLAPRKSQLMLSQAARVLADIDRARALSQPKSDRLRAAFGRLDETAGSRCGLPEILPNTAPKSASFSVAAPSPFASPPHLFLARRTGIDAGLCAKSSDGRAAIPSNFIVDACWDGSVLHLVNRTTLVQRVSGSGVESARRTDFPPQEWSSWFVAKITNDWVLPPNYGIDLVVRDSGASLSVSPAETRLLEAYGIAKVLIGYLPYDPALENAVAGLIHGMDDAVAKGRQCLSGATVLKRVVCSAQFAKSSTWVIGSFIVDASIDTVKKNAVKGTLKHAAGVVWGLVQEGKYVADVFGDVVTASSTQITIAAKPAASGTSPAPGPSSPGSPNPSPPVSTPAPAAVTYAEQQGSHGVNTFTNYHNASGLGPRIDARTTVQVSCKVYDPYIASVNPDGYWYRIASAPWNNAYYSPANTFMNGDPWGGPYSHNTDYAVPNC